MSPRPRPAAPTRIVRRAAPRPEPHVSVAPATRRRAPSGLKVLLVGIDGMAYRIADRLMDEGRLPTLSALRERGTATILRSVPPMRSPSLWTSIATGQDRHEHGILGFLTKDGPGGHLVSVADRRRPALWNILTSFGLESGVVGWWVTWPAEPLRGWMVSDRTVRERWTEWNGGSPAADRTYPAGLMDELAPFVVDPMRPPMDEIDALAGFDPSERAQLVAARHPLLAHGPSVFKFAHAAQRSYEQMAEHMLDTRAQPDLTALFLGATDAVSHTYWHTLEPGRFPGVDRDEVERLGDMIPRYYRHDDDALAELLARVDDHTVVLVVSDHGFRPSGELPTTLAPARAASLDPDHLVQSPDGIAVGQTGQHHPDGILLAAGGPIRAGAAVQASLYDVAPTVLALLGLPVARDMSGRVLEELIDPAFLALHPIQSIDSYAPLAHPGHAPATPDPDPILVEQLRALGYLGSS